MSMAEAESIILPPGFRFHPTDEEIITHYLAPKLADPGFVAAAVGEADLNKCEPWDLPSKAKMGEKEWYFFCYRDKKYPTGMRTNRATESGYWKATGKDKEIVKGKGVQVGMKKTLVFYMGRAPKGEKTNWVMHEFRVEGKPTTLNTLPRTGKDGWVVCKVFHKTTGDKKNQMGVVGLAARLSSTFGVGGGGDDVLLSAPTMPALLDPNYFLPPGSSYAGGDAGKLYFTTNDLPDPNQCNLNPNSTAFYPQIQIPPQMPPQFGAPGLPYFNVATNDGVNQKAEQHSNQSVVSASQETGLSVDRNMEISSKDTGGFRYLDDFDDPMPLSQQLDLDYLWKY